MKTTLTEFILESRQTDEGLNKLMRHIIDNSDKIKNVTKRFTDIAGNPVLDFYFDKDKYSFYLKNGGILLSGLESIYDLPEDINDKLREILVNLENEKRQARDLEDRSNSQSQIAKRLKRFGL